MKVLISAVGMTDPIKKNADGPLLHIVRHQRPDKVILLLSKEIFLFDKLDRVKYALNSIEGYHPEIVELRIAIDEIYEFDKVFDYFSQVIPNLLDKESEETEWLLNLSSGTPQMLAALFALNRIYDRNIRAYQVTTPEKSSNNRGEVIPIEEAVKTNKDSEPDSEVRLLEDKAQKFNQALLKRNLKILIRQYDYKAALNIIEQRENKSLLPGKKRSSMVSFLTSVVSASQLQTIIDDLVTSNYSVEIQKALNAFLLIDVAFKRNNMVEVLIKTKNLAEFLLERYIDKCYLGLIDWQEEGKPRLSASYEDYDFIVDYINKDLKTQNKESTFYERQILNLRIYDNILSYYQSRGEIILNDKSVFDKLLSTSRAIVGLNGDRNKVAHGFDEIQKVKMAKVISPLKEMLTLVYPEIDQSWFTYYEDKNQEMCELLS